MCNLRSLVNLKTIGTFLLVAFSHGFSSNSTARTECGRYVIDDVKRLYNEQMALASWTPSVEKCTDAEVIAVFDQALESHQLWSKRIEGPVEENIFYVYTAYARVMWQLSYTELVRRRLITPSRDKHKCIDLSSKEAIFTQGARVLDFGRCEDEGLRPLAQDLVDRVAKAREAFLKIDVDGELWADAMEWLILYGHGDLQSSPVGKKYSRATIENKVLPKLDEWSNRSMGPLLVIATAKSMLAQLMAVLGPKGLPVDDVPEMKVTPLFQVFLSAYSKPQLKAWPVAEVYTDLGDWGFQFRLFYDLFRRKATWAKGDWGGKSEQEFKRDVSLTQRSLLVRLTLAHSTLFTYAASQEGKGKLPHPSDIHRVEGTAIFHVGRMLSHINHLFLGSVPIPSRAQWYSPQYKDLRRKHRRSLLPVPEKKLARASSSRGRSRIQLDRHYSKSLPPIGRPGFPRRFHRFDETNPYPIMRFPGRYDATNPFPIEHSWYRYWDSTNPEPIVPRRRRRWR